MTRTTYHFWLLTLTVAGLAGCSSEPSAKPAAVAAPDKIQGRAQILLTETTSSDAALNAGGPSVYLIDGLHRYRLFFHKPFEVQAGQVYSAEGVNAQKAIDAIGDPDQGKNGYPLEASCAHVVKTAWPGLAFDVTDGYVNSLLARVKRYPARPVFLVTKIEPVGGAADAKKDKKDGGDEEKEDPKVTVPADKQSALLVQGATTMNAPLWEPAGGTAKCKVVIDEQGKIEKLDSGSQLCESVQWSEFRYKPTVKGGHPIRVASEVVVKFDPRK
jgi:hypothetical protein